MNQTSSPHSESAETDRVYLEPRMVEVLRHVGPGHYGRLFTFLLLYLASSAASVWITHALAGNGWVYVLNMPLYILAAASLRGISLFTHEDVHGTLSVHSWWNRALSIICAQPVLQNFSAYKVLHLRQHQHLGQEGDPDHYANYTSWTWLEFMTHWGRLLVGYPAYIACIPIFSR